MRQTSAVGPVAYTLFSEIPSPQLRSRTIALGLVVQSVFGLVLNLIIPYLIKYVTSHSNPHVAL